MKNHPLITELQKLKESSRYAIAQGGRYDLDDFKKYLHIEREVERRLKDIIIQSSSIEKAQLILVCGNVGDGKSHILSYLHNEIPEEISKFHIHNDATEAHNPDESSNETLYRLLKDFKDENIQKSFSKIILAINLGTLSKFIEEYGSEFRELSDFVQQQHILDNQVVSTQEFDPNRFFQQINFTDFHLYSLTKDGPVSATILELLKKIVTDSESNVIYKAYKEIKDQPEFIRCPVKLNFEFLLDEKHRALIVQLIIQSIAQNKEIVSVRSLLNFIHDIIVPIQLSTVNEQEQLNKIQNLSDKEFLSCLLSNYLFEHADLSNIFSRLAELDPCNTRNDQTDEMLLKLQSIDNPLELFSQHIRPELYEHTLKKIKVELIDKDLISKYFLRLFYFQNHLENITLKNDFQEYIIWLYHFNKGNPVYLSKLYELVENAIKKWHGDPKKGDKIILKTGRRQIKYRIFKDFDLEPNPYIQPNKGGEVLHQFVQEFIVQYKIPLAEGLIRISIDFSLFKTLKMITQGYRPNRKDNNNFVYFVYFINQITALNTQNALYVDEVNVGKPIDYKLTRNAFGGYKFELVS